MSPTIQTLVIGFVSMTVMALLGRVFGGIFGLNLALKLFFPVWLAYASWHMYVGVSQYGYAVMEELPFLLLNFGVPALAALFLLRKFA